MKYEYIDFRFDAEKWALMVTEACEKHGLDTIAALMGMSHQGVKHWRDNAYPEGFEYPRMTNFLKMCNLLDADPREFFSLAE